MPASHEIFLKNNYLFKCISVIFLLIRVPAVYTVKTLSTLSQQHSALSVTKIQIFAQRLFSNSYITPSALMDLAGRSKACALTLLQKLFFNLVDDIAGRSKACVPKLLQKDLFFSNS